MDTIEILKSKKGFIAALDQSGGSSKKTLVNYGIKEELITDDNKMDYIHDMRTRIITNPVFDERVIGTILFEDTVKRGINGEDTVKYLLDKNILTFLKIDKGLEDECDGVRMLKSIPNLDEVLKEAKDKGIVGTKMRSVISEYNEYGIRKLVDEQFNLAKKIISYGLVPIIEPEVSIAAQDKKQIESFLRSELVKHLVKLKKEDYVILKLTLPEVPNFYNEVNRFKNVLRVVALSGGYSKEEACFKLKENKKMIASFSRALLEGLKSSDTDEEFSKVLDSNINEIYTSSVKK